jgi:ABC-2 type transport system ATP-binding protein
MTVNHKPRGDAAIEARHLSKRYGSALAVDDLSFTIEPGRVTGFLRPNGAGKTTTIRCLLGMIRPSAGPAEIFGVDAQAHPAEAHWRVAYVPEEANCRVFHRRRFCPNCPNHELRAAA